MIIKNNLKYLYLCSKLFKIIIENSQILNFGDIEVNYHGKNGNVYYLFDITLQYSEQEFKQRILESCDIENSQYKKF
jgi:hypothetical protein